MKRNRSARHVKPKVAKRRSVRPKNNSAPHEYLQHKKGFFRLILDSLEEYAVYTTDRSGLITSWNAGAMQLLGYSESEVMGESSNIFYTLEDMRQNLNSRIMRRAIRNGKAANQNLFVRKDGSQFWGGGTTFSLRDEKGRIRGFTRIVRDLTRRRILEEERRRNLHILESITDAFFAVDEHWNFTYVNKQAEVLLERPRNDLLKHNFWKEFPGAKKTIIPEHFNQAIKTKKTTRFEVCFEPLNRWFAVRVYPLENGLAVYFNDIDDEKKNKEYLERSEHQLKALFGSSIIGVSYVDLSGHILDANDYFLELIGYSRKELRAGTIRWDHLTPEEYHERDKQAIHDLLTTGVAKPWEKEYIRKDGSRVPIIIAGKLLNKETQETMVLMVDNSERKEIERSKDEFISVASHELKTPVTSIKLFAEILHGQAEELHQTGLTESASILVTQINRLTSLISDLLDVSRIQADKFQLTCTRFSAPKLIHSVVSHLPNIQKSHHILLKGQPNLLIRADRTRLAQVLTNLLTNAVKYSPKANKVIVRWKRLKDSVCITVQDFGFGIPADERKRIFNRFFRTTDAKKNNIPGFGLGLHISAEIVKRHGGTLTVKSEVGKGSIFSVYLPDKI